MQRTAFFWRNTLQIGTSRWVKFNFKTAVSGPPFSCSLLHIHSRIFIDFFGFSDISFAFSTFLTKANFLLKKGIFVPSCGKLCGKCVKPRTNRGLSRFQLVEKWKSLFKTFLQRKTNSSFCTKALHYAKCIKFTPIKIAFHRGVWD